jgi:serine/threonine protein kinase/tetratricopeptide (TPR) repeat protein
MSLATPGVGEAETMPRTTGNAPPPDGHGRDPSDGELTGGGWDAPTGPPTRRPAKTPDTGGIASTNPDATILPAEARSTPPPLPDEDATSYLPPERRPKPLPAPSAVAGPEQASPATAGEDTSPQGPLSPGQPFGTRYRILQCLGVGGMGAVYQAWDAELGVAVALKVIRPEIAADPEAAAEIERRFKRELLLARQVTHPNIIRIHDLGDIGGIKYITMPFIEGSDLATILKKEGKLPVARALRIARGTVAGLVSAHQAGVVHRDLKPANVMINADDDVPTVMDFGIARSAGGPGRGPTPKAIAGLQPADLSRTAALAASRTMAGAIVGTVAYMAPEQARGEAVDQRADIYAFGLILYDMLIGGRRSERAASAVAELQQRMQTPPPPPRSIDTSIPEGVDAIIRRCLEPDPARRFQTTVELQQAFDRLDGDGKPLPIVRRLTRRTVAVAAVLVLLLLAGTFYATRQLSAPPTVHEPVALIIADFQNTTNDSAFNGTLDQALRRALESASFITAFDRTRLRATFGVAAPENFDEVAARQLAIKQGLAVVLAGSIAPSGGGYDITVNATQPMTGTIITSVTRRAANKDQVLTALTRVATSVRNALGDETSDSDQQLAMKTISTTSLEVASHYAAAVNAQARGNAEEALASFAKTVELDPKFGLGYQGLAVMSRNMGRLQDSEKYAAEALRYLDQMTERERYTTRGYYYIRTGDYQACVKEYQELIDKYPADVPGHNQRASCLARLRDMRAAVEEMRKVVAILPNHTVYRSNLAVLLNYSGEFAAAEEEIRKIESPEARAIAALGLSQQGQGLVRDASETYQKLSTMGAFGAAFGPAGLADLAVYEGRFSEAVKILEDGAAADLEVKNADAAAMKYTAVAYAHLARGQTKLAIATADRALNHSTAPPIRYLAARILIEAGAVDRARTMAAAFTSQLGAEQQAYGKILEGGIALKTGDAKLAVKLLTEANDVHDTWLGHFDLGRAFFALKALPQADSEFDRCIQRRGEALTLVDEDPTYGQFPVVYYYLGRVREELKTASFADAYREYLRIRGTSSEDPLVAEVQKRVN